MTVGYQQQLVSLTFVRVDVALRVVINYELST